MNRRTYEEQYLDILKDILENGVEKENRTGINTLSINGAFIKHDMSEGFPALTTKRVFIRGAIEEQLQFMRGNTNTKHLEEKGINYWKGNTSRLFLDKRGLNYLPEGDIGCSYAHQYRNFNGEHSLIPFTKGLKGVDQLKYVYETLLNEPDSRRIMIELWNPLQLKYMALEPCHHNIQFLANKERKELSLAFKMRSNDFFLGNCINFSMYGFFLEAMAKLIGYKSKELIYFGTDVHIYVNHIEQVKEQLKRTPRALPKLVIKKDYNNLEDLLSTQWTDIEIIGYNPLNSIKAEMAI